MVAVVVVVGEIVVVIMTTTMMMMMMTMRRRTTMMMTMTLMTVVQVGEELQRTTGVDLDVKQLMADRHACDVERYVKR